ncbi:MAG: CDP-glycerol glycerophosphotransferase family protein [Roseburia intestinalis]
MIKRIINIFRNRIEKRIAFAWYQRFCPFEKNLVIFEAYGGEMNGYSCNSRAVYERMLRDETYKDFHYVWAFRDPDAFIYLEKNKNTTVVQRGSCQYLRACATAGYLFTNTGYPSYVVPSDRQKMVYLWHGKPLKCIGCSIQGDGDGKRSKAKIERDYVDAGKRLSVLLSPAPVFTPVMSAAYGLDETKRKNAILECGYPRNDALFSYGEADVLRWKKALKIPLDKKVILYAPTWRPYNWLGENHFCHEEVMDYQKLYKAFGEDCVFLCRVHHLERGTCQFSDYPGFLFDVTDYPDVNDLYRISDLMISDYSGTIFDYANLKRPIVLYMYDEERYIQHANGLNFPLSELPGVITHDQEEMSAAVRQQLDTFVYDKKYQHFNETYNCLDHADASGDILRAVIELT